MTAWRCKTSASNIKLMQQKVNNGTIVAKRTKSIDHLKLTGNQQAPTFGFSSRSVGQLSHCPLTRCEALHISTKIKSHLTSKTTLSLRRRGLKKTTLCKSVQLTS